MSVDYAPFWLRLLLCAVIPALSLAFDWRFVRAEIGRRLASRSVVR
jgi:hypothetical protein